MPEIAALGPGAAPRREAVGELATVTRLRPLPPHHCAAPVRLTRRGSLALALLVAAISTGLLSLARVSAPGEAPGTPAGRTPAAVIVRPGDTLWSIATRLDPANDPRAVVDRLEHANHLAGAVLHPGEWLRTG